jgi:hypothetical protein
MEELIDMLADVYEKQERQKDESDRPPTIS